MVNYWLCLTNPSNYKITTSKNVWGVEPRHEKKLKEIRKDDEIIFYIKGKKLGGSFKVISDVYIDEKKVFNSGRFPYRIGLSPIKLPKQLADWTDEIIQNMSFINYKDKRWKFALMGRTIIQITKKDFEYLSSKI